MGGSGRGELLADLVDELARFSGWPMAWPINRVCSSHAPKYGGEPIGWATVGAISDSNAYDSASIPAFVPMIRSGASEAMRS